MADFATAVSKLQTLLDSGLISQAEFNTKRSALLDRTVGITSGGGGRGALSGAGQNPYAMGGRGRGFMGGGYSMMGGAPGPMRGFGGRGAYGQAFHPYGMAPMMGGMMGKGKGMRQRREPSGPSAAVKVAPIPEGTRPEPLKELFSAFGEVASVAVKNGPPPYCFVNFTNPVAANAAATAGTVDLGGGVYATVTLSFPRRKLPMAEGAPSNGIGIFNLPFTTTQEEITAMLSQLAGFQSVKMVIGKSGRFRGYCFANFDSVENAATAKLVLQGQSYGENILDVKFSNRPQE